MIAPPIKSTKELKTPLAQKLKSAILPFGLIGFGILNGVVENPVLAIVGVVSGCLAFAQPYLDERRVNPTLKSAFLVMLGALVFAFLNLF